MISDDDRLVLAAVACDISCTPKRIIARLSLPGGDLVPQLQASLSLMRLRQIGLIAYDRQRGVYAATPAGRVHWRAWNIACPARVHH